MLKLLKWELVGLPIVENKPLDVALSTVVNNLDEGKFFNLTTLF